MKKRRTSADRSRPREKWVEQGAVSKKGRGLIRVALVYPNTYTAGMSSLGFQTVFKLANQIENVTCERVFLPEPRTPSQQPRSQESGMELARFDLVLFSISFENDFFHLAQLLGKAGIPLRSPDRNHTHPLVVAGGVACFLNPTPISCFIDLFLLGEAECLLKPFFKLYDPNPDSRPNLLKAVAEKLPGAWVPKHQTISDKPEVNVQYLNTLDDITTSSTILTSKTAFKDTFLIETLKGCPHGCRFCSAGFIYRPPRVYPTRNITTAMDRIQGETSKIGLVSSAIADHPDIDAICQHGIDQGFQLSFSSLRADKIKGHVLQALQKNKTKTATIAPEAGSERMRKIINKHISNTDVLAAAKHLVQAGVLNLRMYFMIGLPLETNADVQAIIDLTLQVKAVFLEASRKQKKIGTITLSINPFIPKPGTPFQWSAMAKPNILKQRASMIKDALKTTANVQVNVESLRQAKVHALLSLGDEKAAAIIESSLSIGWNRAIKEQQTYFDTIVYKEKPIDASLPWDFIHHHVSKDFLKTEYAKALKAQLSAPCPMIECSRCKTCI